MKTQNQFAGWLLLCAGVVAASAQGPPLTLRQAIDQALGKNPQAAVAHADTKVAEAAARAARTQLLPQLNLTEDISRGNDPVYVFGQRLRQRQFTQADFALNALNRPLPLNNFSTRAAGSWMAFDSFKNLKEIHRADLFRESAGAAAKATDQQIVLRVVSAYQAVLYAQRALNVAEHEQETADALLNDVTQHVNAGLAVDSDRMAAQVNFAARRQELIAAQGQLQMAWAELGTSMGVQELQTSALQAIDAKTFSESSLQDELAIAAKSRPDIAALDNARQAQAVAVSAARSDFGPRVSAYGNWQADRSSLTATGGNNWVAGVQISLDILPLGKREQLARETAARTRAEAQFSQAQLDMRLQVNRAHIQRQTAQLSLETAHAAMAQSTESLRIIRNRYTAGLATITDLLRAEDAERQAQSSYWSAVYGNAMAYTQLLHAEGALSPDAAEVLQ